jgi:hypothetical protein
MRTPASVMSLHDRFKCALTHRYFIRLHMTILISLVLLAVLLASSGLTHAGVRNMGLRYPIAVLFSYLIFFVLVRIWIAYVCRASRGRRDSQSGSSSSVDVGDLFSGGSSGSGGSSSGAGKLMEEGWPVRRRGLGRELCRRAGFHSASSGGSGSTVRRLERIVGIQPGSGRRRPAANRSLRASCGGDLRLRGLSHLSGARYPLGGRVPGGSRLRPREDGAQRPRSGVDGEHSQGHRPPFPPRPRAGRPLRLPSAQALPRRGHGPPGVPAVHLSVKQ